ncbi:MAG: hypothetical protein HPY59_03800 [Anaerolineae bacterium]|nr:hypothetical protein [Anaerolineae bacterium]
MNLFNPQISIWRQIDWLLLGIFAAMTFLIMANADLKKDWVIVMIGLFGGLTIEGWGTQTWLWTYYTNERPPLWIIPAWPIASLSIDRLFRVLYLFSRQMPEVVFKIFYWMVFPLFYVLMLSFVNPTIEKSLTIMALLLCAFLILTPTHYRAMLLTFVAGSVLGYFLERWGTTRQCWVYYTQETPPLFAVLAHGMAATAFWRVLVLFKTFEPKVTAFLKYPLRQSKNN